MDTLLQKTSLPRFSAIDLIRGIAIVSVVMYHALWNLNYIFGVKIAWFGTIYTNIWQLLGSSIFFLLAGFCTIFSRKAFRRIWKPACAALIVSIVSIAAPPHLPIWFGVLHGLAGCMFIYALLRPVLYKIPPYPGILLSLILAHVSWHISDGYLQLFNLQFTLLDALYTSPIGFIFGFPSANFTSSDYFPLIPYFFVFTLGCFLAKKVPLSILDSIPQCKPLEFLGRHSIWVYLLHQPVIYGSMLLYFNYFS